MTTDDVPFTDPCSRCGRQLWSDDVTGPKDGACYEIGGADCELHGQLRDLRSQLRASEAECERLRREVETYGKAVDGYADWLDKRSAEEDVTEKARVFRVCHAKLQHALRNVPVTEAKESKT